MTEWKDIKLEECIETNKQSIGKDYPFSDILYLDTGSITANRIEKLQEFSISNAPSRAKNLVEEEDIIYSSVRPNQLHYGFIKKPKENLVVSTGFVVISCNREKIQPKFLFYYLSSDSSTEYLHSIAEASTSAYPSLKPSDIEVLEIYLPPLPEQKAIAEVLSSLDDKIDLLHRQNKTLEQMAETLFRQWFLPAEASAQAGVEEANEDWGLVKVGDFVATNISTVNKDYPYQMIKYLDTGSLTEGKVEALQELNFNEAPSRAKRLVQHNDVLISTVRPNQKHYGIVKNPINNMIVSTGFCVITCKNIDPHFIYILLTTSDMTEYLHSIAEGSTSTYPSLKPKDIEALEFQLPPDKQLQEFSEYCKNTWDKIDKNQNQIRTLEKMRDTLLPKLIGREVKIM